jgi:hypothetical protein
MRATLEKKSRTKRIHGHTRSQNEQQRRRGQQHVMRPAPARLVDSFYQSRIVHFLPQDWEELKCIRRSAGKLKHKHATELKALEKEQVHCDYDCIITRLRCAV